MTDSNIEKRDLILRRWTLMRSERSTWWSQWQEISGYLLPWSGRFYRTDRDKGKRRDRLIYDNTATRALDVLASGMLAGATSPARPWFRLGTPDPDLNAYQPVKLWLAHVTELMLRVFQKSNTYRSLHSMYRELGAFGTGAALILPDTDTLIHQYPLTTGEYAIATDWQGNVCTIYREFEKTVGEMVKEFGLDNCSMSTQTMYHNGTLDAWVPIIHAIEPRADRDPSKRDNMNMAWSSTYIELGATAGKILREGGFKTFPSVVPRWDVSGGDIYGNSPGMRSLGDIKQLQHAQFSKAKAINYKVDPPAQMPVSLKDKADVMMPGGRFYGDMGPGGTAVKPLLEINFELNEMLEDIQDTRQRINGAFYVDIFMMLANNTDGSMTATEVAVRNEEKMVMLGPVIERLDNELLYPLIETTFTHMLEAGVVPPPPQQMQGMPLSVEMVSMLAQAQKAINTNSVDRFTGNLGMIARMKPDVLDKFNSDAWADAYSDMLGVDPSLIVANDQVAQIRQARTRAQAAQAQAQSAQQMSAVAKNLAASPTGPQTNALQDMMNQYSGYGSPSGVETGQ